MPLNWPDEVQSVFAGDLVTVSAYLTPAGGAIVTPVSPVAWSIRRRAPSP